MYKIFINEYPLVITANEQDFYGSGNFRIVDDKPTSIATAVETLEKSDRGIGNFGLMVMTEDEDATFKKFARPYQRISAAGGLVYNEKGDLLLIFRQGKWDLPKGKVDKGETVEEAAIREVEEECGIEKLELGEPVQKTFHTYFLDQQRILKTTYWFKMTALEYGKMAPQLEENITDLQWFDPKTLDIEALNTYTSIRELLRESLSTSE